MGLWFSMIPASTTSIILTYNEKRHLQGAGNTPKVTDPQTEQPVWRLRLFYTNLSDSVNCAATLDLFGWGWSFFVGKIS